MERFSRNILLIGYEKQVKLASKKVLLVGVGGVGGFCLEALVRSGIGGIDIVDKDVVSISNINRQIVALTSTIGQKKVEVAKARAIDINPYIQINTFDDFYSAQNANLYKYEEYDYIIDCIDTISSKLVLITKAKEFNIPIISAMGCGNKLDPFKFKIVDINQTKVCPLARTMRYELKKLGIRNVKVLYSEEEPCKSTLFDEQTKKMVPGSISFIPSIAGLMIASEVIKDLIN